MAIYLTKILAYLANPLSLSIGIGILAWIAVKRGRQRLAKSVLALALVLLWLCSTPIMANLMVNSLELKFPAIPVAQIPQVDAIAVLGGIVGPAQPPYSLDINLSGAVDRLWHTARLYKAGKAKRVLAVGGNLPWYDDRPAEATMMARILVELGVPESQIIQETKSMNTFHNAVNAKQLMLGNKMNRILLVTSAMHMPRALATFRSAGIDALPAATDYEGGPLSFGIAQWVPDAGALVMTSSAFKEYLGRLYYGMRGWID